MPNVRENHQRTENVQMYSEISHLVSLLSLLYDFSKNFIIRVEGHYVRGGHYVVDILVCPVLSLAV